MKLRATKKNHLKSKKKFVPRRPRKTLRSRGAKKAGLTRRRLTSDFINPVSREEKVVATVSEPQRSAVPTTVSGPEIIIPTIKKSERSRIDILTAEHRPSAYILRLKQEITPPPLIHVLKRVAWEKRWRRVYFFINEISLFSVVALLFWIITKCAQFIFRIPSAALPLPAFQDLPKEALFPLPRLSSLRTISVDRLAASIRLKKEWLQRHWDPREASRPLWPRVAGFALASVLLILPLLGIKTIVSLKIARAEALNAAANGLQSFVDAGQLVLGADYLGAADRFASSGVQFSRGLEAMEQVPTYLRELVAVLPHGGEISAGQHLLTAAEALSRAGVQLTTLITTLTSTVVQPGITIADRWQVVDRLLPELLHELTTAEQSLSLVEQEDIPADRRAQFSSVIETGIPALKNISHELELMRIVVPDLLGTQEPRRYLVVFENNNELRPTGGFMGTFGIMVVRNGRIERLTIPGGGTYDLQGSLVKRVSAPEPLQLINDRWEFQDANWWWDWPTSAKKIQWFYSHAGGETVDGVIAIDSSVIQSLLTVTGPITLPDYQVTISADNFVRQTTEQVEIDYDRVQNRPKQFLADLAPILLARLESLPVDSGQNLLGILGRAIVEKHIQIYRRDDAIEASLQRLGVGGQVQSLPPKTDTLGIVHTNIAGGKTDGVMESGVVHSVRLNMDGSLTDTVELTRTHHGVRGELFTGVRNVDYLRFYVPEGSELISAEGFTPPPAALFKKSLSPLGVDSDLAEIEGTKTILPNGVSVNNEFGRTVFGQWLMVDPGQSATVRFSYRLPWRLGTESTTSSATWADYFANRTAPMLYQFYWEKQPGTEAVALKQTFTSPGNVNILSAPQDLVAIPHGWSLSSTPREDTFLRVKFELQ